MQSFSFAKALTVGCLLCLTLPVACGDDDDSSPTKPGTGGEPSGSAGQPSTDAGAGGAMTASLPPGISSAASTKVCGAEMCDSAKAGPSVFVDPCCATGGACGLNTGFLSLVGAQFKDICQAHAQPGDLDTTCADATGLIIPFESGGQTLMIPIDPFAGCCRANGTCGVVVDKITSGGGKLPIADFELGCVDAAPFFKGQVSNCATGGNGSGGAAAGGNGSGGAATGGAGGNP